MTNRPTPTQAKRVVAELLDQLEEGETWPGYVTGHVNRTLNASFSPPTVARYIQAAGWTRHVLGKGRVVYRRPIG